MFAKIHAKICMQNIYAKICLTHKCKFNILSNHKTTYVLHLNLKYA